MLQIAEFCADLAEFFRQVFFALKQGFILAFQLRGLVHPLVDQGVRFLSLGRNRVGGLSGNYLFLGLLAGFAFCGLIFRLRRGGFFFF